jgi:hypothetical protein
MLAKKHQKVSEKMRSSPREPSHTTPPQSPVTPESCVCTISKGIGKVGGRRRERGRIVSSHTKLAVVNVAM